MPPKILFRMGLSFLFLALAIYFSAGYWLNSRIFVPLDYPVSLDNRQIESPPFQVNLKDTYFASLDLDYSVEDWYQGNRCSFKTILYSQWRVYKLGANPGQPRDLWFSSEELAAQQGYNLNAFRASPGQYQLEWDIPVAASCLNPRHPHLRVFTDSSGYRESVAVLQIFCIFFGGTGFALVVLAGSRVAREFFSLAAAPRMFPGMALRNFIPFVKHRPLPVFHALPHWGIFSGAILWILVIIFMMFRPQTPLGLYVSLSKPEVVVPNSPVQETLGVYVGPGGHFFVNGEEVQRGGLRAKLLEHLTRSVSWTVYFEGNADTVYMDDVYAIDTIQGCGAKLIWITPKMREEWKRKEQSLKHIP